MVLWPKDLEAIWYLLQQHAFEGGADGQLLINYDEFSQVRPGRAARQRSAPCWCLAPASTPGSMTVCPARHSFALLAHAGGR